jgi:hypothetical protein
MMVHHTDLHDTPNLNVYGDALKVGEQGVRE